MLKVNANEVFLHQNGFHLLFTEEEQCLKEDEECNAALTRQEEKTGVQTAALKKN